MNIAIVGFATEGRVSLEYFARRGHQVTVCDQNPATAVPAGIATQLGDSYLDGLHRFDLVVRSAGIPPQLIISQNPGIGPKITTAVNEFLSACPTPHTIGVTGTKGKGTTCTLIAKILAADGKRVFLGGNIGNSPLEFIDQLTPDDWVVLELSSFQLSDMRHSPHLAVCLMVVPEHLNWHVNMSDYVMAKSNLFRYQQPRDTAIYFANNEDSKTIAGHSAGLKIPYFNRPGAHVENGAIMIDNQQICLTSEVKLLGEFNWQNVCAAVTTVWQVTQNVEAFRSVISSFAGLPHHLELVRELDGVRYYDDSFATVPEATIEALRSFEEPKVAILGGSDKGADYESLAKSVKDSTIRKVLLIGDQAERIRAALDRAGFTNYALGGQTMSEIVARARSSANAGDVVLLSTACASFDMFRDYKDRGDQFKSSVLSLAEAA